MIANGLFVVSKMNTKSYIITQFINNQFRNSIKLKTQIVFIFNP